MSCCSATPTCAGLLQSSSRITEASVTTKDFTISSSHLTLLGRPKDTSGVEDGSAGSSATITERPDGSAEFSDSTGSTTVYLLFLKRESDDLYAPALGHVFPDFSILALPEGPLTVFPR